MAYRMILGAATLALAATAPAQTGTWEDIGAGSGSLPGIMRLSEFDDAVPATNRREYFPRLAVVQEQLPVLLFNSSTTNLAFNRNTTHAVAWSGTAWAFLSSASGGRVLPGIETWPGTGVSIAATADQLFAGARGTVNRIAADANAAAFDSSGVWEPRGTSLADGGITLADSLETQTYEVAAGIAPNGSPALVYTKGPALQHELYFAFFNGTAWIGLGGSHTTPIATSPNDTVTNLHPAIAYLGNDPVVFWTRRQNISETVLALRWSTTNGAWGPLTGTVSPTVVGLGRRPQAAQLSGSPQFHLAFENLTDNSLKLLLWNGTALVDDGNPLAPWDLTAIAPLNDVAPSAPDPAASSIALALDSFERPLVAFRAESPADSGEYQIFVSWKDERARWAAIGDKTTGTGSSGVDYSLEGIARKVLGAHAPTLSIAEDNRPVLSWDFDNGIAAQAILVKRWSNPLFIRKPEPAVAFRQAIDRILGRIPSDPIFEFTLDENVDGKIDAADVRRIFLLL